MTFSDSESTLWLLLLFFCIALIAMYAIFHFKRKNNKETTDLREELVDLKAQMQKLKTEKLVKELKSRKIWDMSEVVYKEKRKVDNLNEELQVETKKIEEEKIKIKEKNKKLWEQSIAIHKEKTEIATLHKNIWDSIRYARKIQEAILPTDSYIKGLLPDSFVLFLPRDEVSGDFYWITEKENKVYFAAADCTGHGVPGAFMSMINNTLLNEAINDKDISTPSEIFYDVRKEIITSLKQSDEGQKDGMDAVLCCLDRENLKLSFAAANNPLFLIRDGELMITKPDKMPIGYLTGEQKPFTNHEIQLQKNDIIYIFSDGYQDQFGGPRDKKFMIRRLRELLIEIHTKSMDEQKKILYDTIQQWRGSGEQIDDILFIGVKV